MKAMCWWSISKRFSPPRESGIQTLLRDCLNGRLITVVMLNTDNVAKKLRACPSYQMLVAGIHLQVAVFPKSLRYWSETKFLYRAHQFWIPITARSHEPYKDAGRTPNVLFKRVLAL